MPFTSRVRFYKAIHLHPKLSFITVLYKLGLFSPLLWTKEELAETGIVSDCLRKVTVGLSLWPVDMYNKIWRPGKIISLTY